MHDPYRSAQAMAPERVYAVGRLTSFCQLLQQQVPCNPDSTHERSEGEEVEAIQGPEVPLFLLELVPTHHEAQVPSRNESPTY